MKEIYILVFFCFALVSEAAVTVRVLPTDYDNDQYGSFSTGCEYKVEFTVSSDITLSPPFTFSIPYLISTSNSTNTILGNNNTFYNELSFKIPFGGNGDANVVVEGTNYLLISYLCERPPFPLTNSNNNPIYIYNHETGYHTTILKLNLKKPCQLITVTISSPYTCFNDLMVYDGLFQISCKIDFTQLTTPLDDILVVVSDKLDRTTQISFPSFVQNSNVSKVYSTITYSDPRATNILARTGRSNYILTSSNGYTTGDIVFLLNNNAIFGASDRIVNGLPGNITSLISEYYFFNTSTIQVIQGVSFVNGRMKKDNLSTYDVGPLSVQDLVFETISATNTENFYVALINVSFFTPQQIIYQIKFGNVTMVLKLSYPYNLKTFSQLGKQQILLLLPNYRTSFEIYTIGGVQFATLDSSTPWGDSQPPKLISIQYFPLKNAKMLIRVTATDDVSGVYMIVINSEFTLNSWDISDGNANNGTYEIIVDYSASVQIPKQTVDLYDFAGNLGKSSQFPVNEIPLYPKFPLTTTPMKYYQNITAIRFSFNDIDLSVVGAQLQFFVNFLNVDKEFNVYLMILDPVGTINNNYWIVGQWSESDKMYKINIDLPSRLFTGVINYQLKYKGLIYTTNELRLTGLDYELRVISDFADQMPPIIQSITRSNPTPLDIPPSQSSISWTLLISDPDNGFKQGTIKVTSSIDILEYEFTFNTTTPVISIPITDCISQNFTITYINLIDNNGFTSTYDPSNLRNTYINPFLIILESIYDGTLMMSTTCSSPDPLDTTPPTCSYSGSELSVDVSSSFRKIVFELELHDETALSRRHIPYCTISAGVFRELKVQSIERYYNTSDSKYECTFNIPFGFGDISTSAYLTISGFSDTSMNFGNMGSFIDTFDLNFTRATPIIESVDRITSDGQLTIYGKNFQIPPSAEVTAAITYIDGSPGESIFDVDFHSNIMLIVTPNGGVPIEKQFQVFVNIISTLSRSSDAFDGLPYIPPRKVTDPPQSLCKGTPLCGGPSNGNCSTDGCVCISPWYGIDCLSQTIKIDPPTIDTTNPNIIVNVTLPDGENVSLSSLITLVSLDEIDNSNQIINSHLFTTWNYTNTTGENIDYQEHTYSTNITNNDVNTLVKVRLQYFIVGKTIYFANQELSILPSTLKYNIEMSSYPFSNSLNHLQLVLSASLESSNSDGCSIQESGEILNSDYLKLQINSNSLYGRFIKRGVIDNRIQIISNTITNNSTQTSSTTTRNIGINIPWYKSNILLDPDFSLLVDTESAKSKDQSICNNSKDESGLTKSQLIGIIVSCICFGLVLIIIGGVILYKKSILFKVGVNKVIKLGKMDQ